MRLSESLNKQFSSLQEEDDKLQKKTYRVIEQICHSHAIWVITNKEALDLIRSGTLTAQASATKKVCVYR